jgi:hypothetical protein
MPEGSDRQIDDALWNRLKQQHAFAGQEISFVEDDTRFRVDWLYKIAKDGKREPTRLLRALQRAAAAESLIPGEVERLTKLLEEAKAREKPRPHEVEAREYQIEYVKTYLQRAAEIARDRIDYFADITTPEIAEKENELCQKDKRHWFKYYAWGYDPRARTPLSTVPFELFPRQGELVDWLDDLVFEKRTSGLIEKSRDEGATELIIRWAIHNWRYREGFSMLLSSRTEDEVDTKKKQGTLFSRARFQISLLPNWMLPANKSISFDVEKDMLGHMIIGNPVNDNALQGQPPVENMGRGDRVTCAMFDEFAFWRFGGYPQYTSMSQTTDSIIMPSSVAGELNQYADLAFDGVTEKFEMDWRDHPFKDKRWYNALGYGYIGPKMSHVAIAQEIDRNYKASQPGKVWKYSEPHMMITWDELVAYYAKFGLAKNFTHGDQYAIPQDWSVTRTHDYGQSDDHEWGYLLGAQPREVYPLHDTHFIFLARNLEPLGLTEAQAVAQWTELEIRIGVRHANGKWRIKPKANWHSHEQKDLRKVLRNTYGETWVPWDTSYERGLSTVQDWFEVIDDDKPNPFRPELHGRTKIVFVAPPGEYKLAYNDRLGIHFVTTSTNEDAFYTLRRQIGAYHYPQSEMGKARKDMRPEKTFDDIVDCLRGYALNWNRNPDPPTDEEKVEMHMPDAYKLSELRRRSPHKKGLSDSQYVARALVEAEVREKLKLPKQQPRWLSNENPDEVDLDIDGGGW